jgi:hypothetical protein
MPVRARVRRREGPKAQAHAEMKERIAKALEEQRKARLEELRAHRERVQEIVAGKKEAVSRLRSGAQAHSAEAAGGFSEEDLKAERGRHPPQHRPATEEEPREEEPSPGDSLPEPTAEGEPRPPKPRKRKKNITARGSSSG